MEYTLEVLFGSTVAIRFRKLTANEVGILILYAEKIDSYMIPGENALQIKVYSSVPC